QTQPHVRSRYVFNRQRPFQGADSIRVPGYAVGLRKVSQRRASDAIAQGGRKPKLLTLLEAGRNQRLALRLGQPHGVASRFVAAPAERSEFGRLAQVVVRIALQPRLIDPDDQAARRWYRPFRIDLASLADRGFPLRLGKL